MTLPGRSRYAKVPPPIADTDNKKQQPHFVARGYYPVWSDAPPKLEQKNSRIIQESTSMSWPRGSILAALLVLSIPLACADTITVNTTTDDNAVNSLCSLREAVEYFNQGKPAAGYQGCVAVTGTTGGADIINLTSDAAHPYPVSSPIYIHHNVTINGAGASVATRTIIKATGPNRIFVFYDKPSFQAAACGLSTPTTCSAPTDPVTLMSAPVLAPASDTGVSSSDFLTSDTTPVFSGTLNAPDSDLVVVDASVPGTTTTTTTKHRITVRLYQISAKNVTPALVQLLDLKGTASSTGTQATWSIPTFPLPQGDQSIFYTTQSVTDTTVQNTVGGIAGPEFTGSVSGAVSPPSPATAIRIYPASVNQTVVMSQLDLEGCSPLPTDIVDCSASADVRQPAAGEYTDNTTGLVYHYDVAGTANKGGIIFGTGSLTLSDATVNGGRAGMGGAVYVGTEGGLQFNTSEARNNKADHGAAFYVAHNALIVSRSLLTANTVNLGAPPDAAVIEVKSVVLPPGGAALIENSTLSGNTGVALSLLAGSIVNSSTIVLNDGGINFNNASVSVYNSIVAGNPDKFPATATATPTDCMSLPVTPDFSASVSLSGGGCDSAGSAGLTLLFNDAVAGHESGKLMAILGANGHCAGYQVSALVPSTFKGMGVLCPLLDNGGPTKTHLIRLLPTYTSVSDSPLMTKGSSASSASTACLGIDQRSKIRHFPCDVGALELQPMAGSATSGDVITYGQTYTPKDYDLSDEELLDPAVSACPVSAQTLPADIGKMGCPWLEKAPTRGTVTFNSDGTYTYKPSSDFHGFDRFTIRVVTTLSRLNSVPASQSRLISAQVIVEPTSGISSSSLGGAFDWEVMLLGGLLGLVRLREKDEGK